jgi:hypothetical protein
MYPGETMVREFHAELSRVLAAHPKQHFATDLLDVLRTALYLLVSVPLYALASVAIAAAMYVRLAGALLIE